MEVFIILLHAAITVIILVNTAVAVEDGRNRLEDLGPCQACKAFVESFERGMQRTAQLPTQQSTQRLVDIQQGICEEPRSKLQCLQTTALARPFIEEWWLHRDKEPDLYAYICINKLQVCCPKHHYGKQCLPCHGDLENLCNMRGKCRGDGTRKGNGTCLCDPGYGGEFCDKCVTGYYMDLDPMQLTCARCHYSCMGGCHSGTPRDCVACRPGFTFDREEGCQDINECNDINICKKDEFCLNSPGSYKCMKCDKACKGCYGDSPDMCRKCAKGYSKKGDICIQDREDEEMDQMTVTRYMTYIGLLVTASVLLPKSSSLGAAVGAVVLAYIVGAEYYCAINGHASLLDLAMFNKIN